ncbi:MAG: hypothetical protein A2W22_03380 [Candidatus Levybacteria bacterium RBG_16_35_11]|nr:MAG: hypothetical protein A2W22_03380 [Candidatus Levybacteria bacterium RBG_16_35_11]
MPKDPLVSIVIPTYNRKEMVERLINSIFANSYKNLEIIVIDDASPDDTLDYLKKKFAKNKKLKVIKNRKNLFTAGSRNVGIKNSKGELIFFIDDDNVLDKDTVKFLVEEFNIDEKLGEAGPVNYNYNNKKKALWFITKRNMFTTKTSQPRDLNEVFGKKVWETVDIPNAFMVRKSVIEKNKIFFREKLGIMYEESDFAYRIKKAGYSIRVIRNAKIYHDIEKKEGSFIKDYMYHFMVDKRRPFVIARNRIIFHSIYSTNFQFFFILVFFIWFFTAYYFYKIIFYKGLGKFSAFQRLALCGEYLRGSFIGLSFVTSGKRLD